LFNCCRFTSPWATWKYCTRKCVFAAGRCSPYDRPGEARRLHGRFKAPRHAVDRELHPQQCGPLTRAPPLVATRIISVRRTAPLRKPTSCPSHVPPTAAALQPCGAPFGTTLAAEWPRRSPPLSWTSVSDDPAGGLPQQRLPFTSVVHFPTAPSSTPATTPRRSPNTAASHLRTADPASLPATAAPRWVPLADARLLEIITCPKSWLAAAG